MCVLCVRVCAPAHAHMHVVVYMWRSKDNYVELVLFFHLAVGSDDQSQVARPGE